MAANSPLAHIFDILDTISDISRCIESKAVDIVMYMRWIHKWLLTSPYAIIALPYILLAVVLVFLPSAKNIRRKVLISNNDLRTAMEALLIFANPTRSIWPPTYFAIARRAVSTRNHTLEIPLSTLIDSIITGKLELRDAHSHLPNLILGELEVQGWRIQLQVESSWWARVSTELVASRLGISNLTALPIVSETRPDVAYHYPLNSSHTTATSSGTKVKSYSIANVSWIQLPAGPTELKYASSIRSSSPALNRPDREHTLDNIPPSQLKSFIQHIKQTSHSVSSMSLCFSTLSTNFALSNPLYLLASIPFLVGQHVPPSSKPTTVQSGFRRTLTPLMFPLDAILRLLTSENSPLRIQLVKNISEEFASTIDDRMSMLERDVMTREVFLGFWGIEAWREERFCLAWEAALHRAGVLTRWKVVVSHPTG
ncbi:hypothetical protein ABKN59_001455 [Abortiporus biennis]